MRKRIWSLARREADIVGRSVLDVFKHAPAFGFKQVKGRKHLRACEIYGNYVNIVILLK